MLGVIKILVAYVLFPALSYLLGSLSFGLIVGRIIGVDIRKGGSGNIGATNVWRVLGRGPAIAVFALDVLKGAVPALFLALIAQAIAGVPSWKLLGIIYGACAIFGHVYPCFFDFRGGKAVATSCGVFLAIAPVQTFTALMIWLTVLTAFKYVSVASMSGAASFFLMVLIFYPASPIREGRGSTAFLQNGMRALYPSPNVAAAPADMPADYEQRVRMMMSREKMFVLLLSLMAAGIVIYRHRSNIKRLREGTEPRILTSKADLRAAEAEKKFGKERLATAGKRKKSSVDLRAISKPKKAADGQPAAAGTEGAAQPAGDTPADAKPAGAGEPGTDQMETEAPLEDLQEITAENLQQGAAPDKIDTEETRELGKDAEKKDQAPHEHEKKSQPSRKPGDKHHGHAKKGKKSKRRRKH